MRLITGLIGALIRLALLPFRIVLAVVFGTIRAGLAVVLLPFRVVWGMTRRAGFSGFLCFGLGVAAGILLAPSSGREVRGRLQELATGQATPPDHELAESVASELSHGPRTWQLPQPDIQVVAGVVTLTGTVADAGAREELEAAAARVPGVVGVVNEIVANPALADDTSSSAAGSVDGGAASDEG